MIMQHCVLLMQNAFICFAGDGFFFATSGELQHLESKEPFSSLLRVPEEYVEFWMLLDSGRLNRKQPSVVTPGGTEGTAVSAIQHI